jgi:PIN domain nuclease of toxin-antitoxin system
LLRPLPEIIDWQQQHNGLQILPITLNHIYTLANLPHHHRDPFDRMLIAQAQFEDLSVLRHDAEFSHYRVTVLW